MSDISKWVYDSGWLPDEAVAALEQASAMQGVGFNRLVAGVLVEWLLTNEEAPSHPWLEWTEERKHDFFVSIEPS